MKKYIIFICVVILLVIYLRLNDNSSFVEEIALLQDQIIQLEEKNKDAIITINSLEKENDKLILQVELYDEKQRILDKYRLTTMNQISGSDINLEDLDFILLSIPEGWSISTYNNHSLSCSIGDLNEDGVDDLAVVIENKLENQRQLVIAMGNSAGGYSASDIYDIGIPSRFEGGGYGDPMEYIGIINGYLVLKFYGGGSSRYFMNFSFSYIDSSLKLVYAKTGSTVPTENEVLVEYVEINYITGEYTEVNVVKDIEISETGTKPDLILQDIEAFKVGFIQD